MKWTAVAAALLNAALCAAGGASAEPTREERVAEKAREIRLRLDFDGAKFSGPAWDRLVAEGRAAQFFLLGEEHGVAETPKLAAALFEALAPAGYAKFAIEVSPPVAAALDDAARGGEEGLRALYAEAGGPPAFFGMKEEADMVVAVRAAAPRKDDLFWGVDYEVLSDRLLIAKLEDGRKPKAAQEALADLRAASDAAWKQYEETRNPQFIFSFSGDPALVRGVRAAWPNADAESASILKTLEETLEINRLWVKGDGFGSNERRSAFLRENFLEAWRAEKASGRGPKVFLKLGASHVVRGRNMSETYDIGALVPEIAAIEGGRAFHLLVLPGPGAPTAVFDPATLRTRPGPPKDNYLEGVEAITGAAHEDAFTLIDLRPLRAIVGRARLETHPELIRVVHGFDAVLVLTGSTASENF